jgi:hypothetical protein
MDKKPMFNGRKGFTLSGLMEAILVIVAFIFVTNLVVAGFNTDYSQNLTLPTGLEQETQLINTTLVSQSQQAGNASLGGEIQQNSFGFSIVQAGSLFLAFLSTAWYVMTGGWIPDIIVMSTNGWVGSTIIGDLLRVFFVIGLVFALIRVVQRIRP